MTRRLCPCGCGASDPPHPCFTEDRHARLCWCRVCVAGNRDRRVEGEL